MKKIKNKVLIKQHYNEHQKELEIKNVKLFVNEHEKVA